MDFLGLTNPQWIDLGISLLFSVAVVVLGRRVVDLLIGPVASRLAQRTSTTLDDAVLGALRSPLYWFLMLLVLKVSIGRLGFVPESWSEPLDNLFYLLNMLVGFFFMWRLVHDLFLWYGREIAAHTETKLDEQLLPFFRRVVLGILGFIGIILLLGRFEIDVSALVTTLGVGSLAIALAAQAALSDTISGFIIMIDRPFRIGDRVEIQDLDTWGDVVDIGLRSTRIRTRDNRMIIVPNSVISKSLVVNYSYPDRQYRIQVHIGIDYESDIEMARRTMIEAVRAVDGVVPERKVEALFLEFGNTALIFRLRWWIDSYVDTRRMFDKVNTAVLHALNEAGVEIPMDQVEVHHRFEDKDAGRAAAMSD